MFFNLVNVLLESLFVAIKNLRVPNRATPLESKLNKYYEWLNFHIALQSSTPLNNYHINFEFS